MSVTLTVSSAWPLAKVYSSTHPAREEKAGSAARLLFTAQEYVPTRDFEAVIELASTPNTVTMLPHRRGEDGYFLLRLAPPQGNAGWEREVVRDGPPLHLLILCDTSASIDKQQRSQQGAFVDALLGSLTARDTFNLACFDVETDWAFAQQQSTDAKTISLAQTMLNGRRSMGWTDFEKAFSSAQKQAAQIPGTIILYLGDGIPAMSWGHDPKVLVDRLKSMVSRDKAPVHAVALGSTHEPQTLRAMANLSGGSWRKIAADRGPALQARDLLQELTDPNLLRDLKVNFEGLQTARVYPETLPNVQQGTGLVLTGRYLPGGKAQTGKVTVSGLRGNTPVKYQASVTLPDNDAGNSFIPRLWARQHIESLLESGGSAARDEIIARSEEFHLMTPYTSFLVLENDAMRERFAVKKHFNMRDGERFFANGKTQSELLLRQKQMKLAAEWRVNLQNQTLAQLGTLGKLQPQDRSGRPNFFTGIPIITGTNISPESIRVFAPDQWNPQWYDSSGNMEIDGKININSMSNLGMNIQGMDQGVYLGGVSAEFGVEYLHGKFGGDLGGDLKRRELTELNLGEEEISNIRTQWVTEQMNEKYDKRLPQRQAVLPPLSVEFPAIPPRLDGGVQLMLDESEQAMGRRTRGLNMFPKSDVQGLYSYDWRSPYVTNPLNLQQLFPPLGPAPLLSKPVASKPPVWSPEIVDIIKSLDQRAKLRQLQGIGLMIDRAVEIYEPRSNTLRQINRRSEYLSSTGWLYQQMQDQSPTLLEWCTPTESVALNLTYFTGRYRSSSQPERELLPIDWDDKSLEDVVTTYGQLPARMVKLAGNLVCITLTYPEKLAVNWIIDTQREVLVKVEQLNEGKVNSSVVYEDFQQVGGRWWATRQTVYDARGRVETQSIQKLQAVGNEIVTKRLDEARKQQATCLMLPSPLPTLSQAKKATASGGPGGAVEHLLLMSHFAATQQWNRVNEHLAQLERLPQKYAVVPWIRLLVLSASRDHATLQNAIWKHTQALMKQPLPNLNDDWALYSLLQTQLTSVSTTQEVLRYLEAHSAIYARQPAYLRPMREYQRLQAQYLASANRREEVLAIWKKLALSDLFDSSAQSSYFSTLLQANEVALHNSTSTCCYSLIGRSLSTLMTASTTGSSSS